MLNQILAENARLDEPTQIESKTTPKNTEILNFACMIVKMLCVGVVRWMVFQPGLIICACLLPLSN
jgi:hypothetical protein